jgi:TonB-dependent starch-binding outer membrane protein SusC
MDFKALFDPRLFRCGVLTKTWRIMRLTALILFVACLHVSARTYSQIVTLTERNASLQDIFKAIHQQTGYQFFYEDTLLDKAGKISIIVKNAPVDEVLAECLKDLPITFSIVNRTIIVKEKMATTTQNLNLSDPKDSVKGKITNDKGEPLSGASVVVKGSNKGTTTAGDGTFTLKDVDPGKVLVISYTGFAAKEVKVGDDLNITIALQPSNNPLDEAQVIAYGTTTQRLSVGNTTTVQGDEIEKQPVSNPLIALEGMVPGLYITQGGGLPGTGVNVLIQGQNSIQNGIDPLYVIDGVPYPSELLPNLGTSFLAISGSPLSYISPSDIESISVLKDADATAIYGSRAANGAILITTKKGKNGQTKVDLHARTGWGKISKGFDMLNTQQYLAMRREGIANSGLTVGPYDYDINGTWDTTKYTNWQKVLIGGTSQYTDANGSISGGNTNTQYLIGANYHRETTVFPGDYSDIKAGMHFNLTSLSSNQKFRVLFSGSYLVDNNHLPDFDLTSMTSIAPDAPAMYNATGGINWAPDSLGNSTFLSNPLGYLVRMYSNKTNNLVASSTLTYTLLPGLDLKSNFGYTNLQSNEVSTLPLVSFPPEYQPYYQRTASYSDNNITTWIIEPQVNYHQELDIGRLNVLIGSTIQQTNSNGDQFTGTGYNSDASLEDIHSAATIFSTGSVSSVYKYAALFGRINYSWKDKFLFNISDRRDGSSRFGSANQYHDFWSAGAGWVFSRETFIARSLPAISFGKLRLNYGTTGNDQIGDYNYLSLYNVTTTPVPYQGATGLSPASLPNPYLEWELTKKLDAGLDLGVLKDRITLNASYFLNKSSNQLLPYTLPIISGFNSVLTNFPATVQNKGWELVFRSINIKTRNFQWSTAINLTIPQNKLIAFPNLSSSSYANTLVVGQSLAVVKAFHYLGVNATTGLYQFADSHGNPTSAPDPLTDNTVIINPNPKYYGGFQNSVAYKGLRLDFLFQFVKKIGQNLAYGIAVPGIFNQNQPKTVLGRWQQPGDMASIQKFNSDFSELGPFLDMAQSDANYTDASFIRLKNVELSWQLPNSFGKKTGLQQPSVFVSAQNLFLITKYKEADPEIMSMNVMPLLKIITLGLHVGL